MWFGFAPLLLAYDAFFLLKAKFQRCIKNFWQGTQIAQPIGIRMTVAHELACKHPGDASFVSRASGFSSEISQRVPLNKDMHLRIWLSQASGHGMRGETGEYFN